MTLGAGTFSGKPVRRVEDLNLLRGAGTYVDNLKIEGMLTLYFVRSPIAHATIRSIDVKAAREMPGVVAVYSANGPHLPRDASILSATLWWSSWLSREPWPWMLLSWWRSTTSPSGWSSTWRMHSHLIPRSRSRGSAATS